MSNKIIEITYNQGDPVIIEVNRDLYKSDKEFEKSINSFLNTVDKYTYSCQLVPVHSYLKLQNKRYIGTVGIRDVNVYDNMSSYVNSTLHKFFENFSRNYADVLEEDNKGSTINKKKSSTPKNSKVNK